jgi:hypothetical protein
MVHNINISSLARVARYSLVSAFRGSSLLVDTEESGGIRRTVFPLRSVFFYEFHDFYVFNSFVVSKFTLMCGELNCGEVDKKASCND